MDIIHEKLLPDSEIDEVWGSADFGPHSRRDIIKESLIKCLAGYKTGHTAKCICIDLELIFANKWQLTAKGRKYLGEALLETETKIYRSR